MTWKDFRDQVVAQLDKVGVHLSYQLNVDAHTWLDLSCVVDLMTTLTCVVAKALVAHKWVISMDIKNEVSDQPFMNNNVLTFSGAVAGADPKGACSQEG